MLWLVGGDCCQAFYIVCVCRLHGCLKNQTLISARCISFGRSKQKVVAPRGGGARRRAFSACHKGETPSQTARPNVCAVYSSAGPDVSALRTFQRLVAQTRALRQPAAAAAAAAAAATGARVTPGRRRLNYALYWLIMLEFARVTRVRAGKTRRVVGKLGVCVCFGRKQRPDTPKRAARTPRPSAFFSPLTTPSIQKRVKQ